MDGDRISIILLAAPIEAMGFKRGLRQMFIPTVVMGVVAVVFLFVGYRKGAEIPIMGLKSAGTLLVQMLPLLVFAFIVAGIIPHLVSQETISQWIGSESGIKGILIGTFAGGLLPGGPVVVFPLAVGFLRAGAGIGTIVAFVTGWSLLAFGRLPVELGIMGWKFTAIRFACTFFFAPVAGIIANKLFSGVSLP